MICGLSLGTATLEMKEIYVGASAQGSFLLSDDGLTLTIEGNHRRPQRFDGLPVPVACKDGRASPETLSDAAFPRHHDDLVFDPGHALRHLHALAHRCHDVRGNLRGLKLFRHGVTWENANQRGAGIKRCGNYDEAARVMSCARRFTSPTNASREGSGGRFA